MSETSKTQIPLFVPIFLTFSKSFTIMPGSEEKACIVYQAMYPGKITLFDGL